MVLALVKVSGSTVQAKRCFSQDGLAGANLAGKGTRDRLAVEIEHRVEERAELVLIWTIYGGGHLEDFLPMRAVCGRCRWRKAPRRACRRGLVGVGTSPAEPVEACVEFAQWRLDISILPRLLSSATRIEL